MRGLGAEFADVDQAVALADRDGDSPALIQTLVACAQLAGALEASLLKAEPLSTVASSVDYPTIDVDCPTLRHAIEREAALMFPTTRSSWVEPDGNRPGATAIASLGSGAAAHILALSFRGLSTFARARVARLMPTLVTLVAAQFKTTARLVAAEEQRAIQALALDHGHCGVIAVRDDHSIIFANAAATTMLADGDGLHVKRGVVRPIDFRQAVRFEAALDAVQEHSRVNPAAKYPALVMLLPSQRNARPLIVAIVPARADAAAIEGVAALIYFFQPEHSARGLDTIAELHGLSGVERRLLAELCAGLTVAESAERLRIKLETARAYLKQIFVKTGTHRQSELVVLMTRYLQVVRGDFDFQPA